jgi:N-acyl-D-amino-acid deacylase
MARGILCIVDRANWVSLKAGALSFLVCAIAAYVAAQQPNDSSSYDLIIQGGMLVDGSGNKLWQADVAVQGDRIGAIGDLNGAARKRTINARGLVVSPGFIDMHNHSDDSLLDEPKCESMIRQGVTTMVLGEGTHRVR